MTKLFSSTGRTNVGMVRKNNEDSYIFKAFGSNGLQTAFIAAVADGMGGHAAGEVASAKLTEILQDEIEEHSLENMPYKLKELLEYANDEIYRLSSENNDLRGMGTTCTAMFYSEGFINIAHVGDSRAYFVRDGSIELITKDHTIAQELLDSGTIDDDTAKTCPERNILLRAIGTSPYVEVDTYENIPVKPGDIFILCSDGLTEYVDKNEIMEKVLNNTLDDVCDVLISLANVRGGADNITVQVIKIISPNNNDKNENKGVFKRIRNIIR